MESIDISKTATQLVAFIAASFQKEGLTEALIAVSGGVDSATSLILTVKALGVKHVHPVLLPYGQLRDKETTDARMCIDMLAIPRRNVIRVNIQPIVDAMVSRDTSIDNVRKGNIMARIRMMVLYDLVKKLSALVVGTENKTEHILGYYTRFGDEASDIEPLRHLYKTEVYALARHIGVPPQILQKAPSAGLWQGQTDESEFGFTYEDADRILYLHVDKHISRSALTQRGFPKKLLERVWQWMDKGKQKARLPHVFIK